MKSALIDGKRDHTSPSSIHRFMGFQFLTKEKEKWGECFVACSYEYVKENDILVVAESFMRKIDCPQCVFLISYSSLSQKESLETFILECASSGYLCEIIWDDDQQKSLATCKQQADNVLAVKWVHKNLITIMKQCEFWSYWNTKRSICVHTRESKLAQCVTPKGLLSNHLYGVDNTGNVCVWPTETILASLLVDVCAFSSSVAGKTVLELGGGLTSLAGLALACDIPTDDGSPSLPTREHHPSRVVLTDGHPDCVANQVIL